ncbi:hypothetical protein COT30_05210 [Candidatus Micrarchaeota archaeon CG08_land_8_20_14_0_20_49_17]|nr:MAG: hypothetical protein COT30_05210 [Candidatus Micrarchaeota archaeon CG08_land_8_20_14_0_20_49_17]
MLHVFAGDWAICYCIVCNFLGKAKLPGKVPVVLELVCQYHFNSFLITSEYVSPKLFLFMRVFTISISSSTFTFRIVFLLSFLAILFFLSENIYKPSFALIPRLKHVGFPAHIVKVYALVLYCLISLYLLVMTHNIQLAPENPEEDSIPPVAHPRIGEFRAVVIGGGGFIGKQLLGMLLALKQQTEKGIEYVYDKVIALGPHWKPFFNELLERYHTHFEVIVGNITQPGSLDALAPHLQDATHVYHLAVKFNAAFPELVRVNVDGTRNILQCCAAGEHIGKQSVMVFGSASVYPPLPDIMTEDMPPGYFQGMDQYSVSKLMMDSYVRQMIEGGLPVSLLRLTAVYGPDNPHMIGKLARLAKIFPPVGLLNFGSDRVALVSAYDAAAIHLAHLRKPGVYNVAEPPSEAISREEFVTKIFAATGRQRPNCRIPHPISERVMHECGWAIGINRSQGRYVMGPRLYSPERLLSTGFRFTHSAQRDMQRLLR